MELASGTLLGLIVIKESLNPRTEAGGLLVRGAAGIISLALPVPADPQRRSTLRLIRYYVTSKAI